jgi:SRSO17 transposase
MTEQEIAGIGVGFSNYLRKYHSCFSHLGNKSSFDVYCRGLLSDLPRKSVEPLALASGRAVRTLQQFLAYTNWDEDLALDIHQRHQAEYVQNQTKDSLGTVGVIDETSCLKKGDRTPGVQRQYLGCVGKVDNGIVTVHVGVSAGRYQTLLASDLYVPESWDSDRERCRDAGIPDDVRYRPKWLIALGQIGHLAANGLVFDWLTFDEGYGGKVPFLKSLSLVNQKFVGEVPVTFSVKTSETGAAKPVRDVLTETKAKKGNRYRLKRRTHRDQVWRAVKKPVWVGDEKWLLVIAINESTAEVKYFICNALDASLKLILRVAFRRATIEHLFRIAKGEVGLMHYEGRNYKGLMRHMIIAMVVMGFVSIHTDRLRKKKSAGHDGTDLPSAEQDV